LNKNSVSYKKKISIKKSCLENSNPDIKNKIIINLRNLYKKIKIKIKIKIKKLFSLNIHEYLFFYFLKNCILDLHINLLTILP
jgi:hypothetical protein